MKATRTLLGTAVDAALQPFELEQQGGQDLVQAQADRLSEDLMSFVVAAWPHVWPNEDYVHGWHAEAICWHLQQVSEGHIRRLQVWVPPGSTKSTIVSIMWPAWEWTRKPTMRYITASYDLNLATTFSVRTRDLIKSDWYRLHWPQVQLRPDWDLKRSYANTVGGTRLATSVGGDATVTGQHGHRLVIDDPLNAQEVLSEANLAAAVEWHDGSMSTRFVDPKTSAEVIIMQRLSELDLAAHVLEIDPDQWTILCLPEAYEKGHPYAWPADPRDPDKEPTTVTNPDGTSWVVPQGDGALLIPGRIGQPEHEARQRALGAHRAAGQLQQRPAPREGAILKRALWRYYPPSFLEKAERHDVTLLPQFTRIVSSWDTAFKDKTTSDYVCGTVWGIRGGLRYLLRLRKDRMGFAGCMTAMDEAYRWAVERWPHAGITTLVENRANGPEIVQQLRKELPGVIPHDPSLDKTLRAEACEPDFESGSVYVPGAMDPGLASYDVAETPAWVQELIEEAAVFPNGQHDDQVDSLTMALNWSRVYASGRAFGKKPEGRVPTPNRLRAVS